MLHWFQPPGKLDGGGDVLRNPALAKVIFKEMKSNQNHAYLFGLYKLDLPPTKDAMVAKVSVYIA